MKNKDGIEIKVGQVWKLSETPTDPAMTVTVDAITNNGFYYVTENNGLQVGCMHANSVSLYVETLISDPDQPWLPLPDGYRLVTDEEKEKSMPDCVRFFCGTEWCRIPKPHSGAFSGCYKYAVPVDFQFEQPKPKYKLFEIDWKGGAHPTIETNVGCASIGLYPVSDGYRIGWGFTEASPDDFYDAQLAAYVERECYSRTPISTKYGNLTYAIGIHEG